MTTDRMGFLALLLAAPLAACGGPEAVSSTPKAPAPAAVVAPALNSELSGCGPATAEGYCGVTFGMTPQEAKAVFPAVLVRYSADVELLHDANQCFEMFAEEPVQGVSFLVENNAVGRVDVMSPGPVTTDGFGVGATAESIRAKYGAALEEGPNKYEPEITELTIEQGAGKILFEIQDGKVRAWRAGVPPLIDYVERCG